MKKYIGKRIISFLIVLVGVSILFFVDCLVRKRSCRNYCTPRRIQSYAGTD